MVGDHVVLVLLAAGDSRRFGANKLLADFEGKPMYRHIVDEIAGIGGDVFYRKLVVSQYPEILSRLKEEGYEAIENCRSDLGISHSIHLALGALDGREDAVCFAVCDQPGLRGATVCRLVKEWRENGRKIACLSCMGRDGNPAVFAREYEQELLRLTGDAGGRRVIRNHPEALWRCEIGDERELEDVDEPSQIAPAEK